MSEVRKAPSAQPPSRRAVHRDPADSAMIILLPVCRIERYADSGLSVEEAVEIYADVFSG